MPQAPSATASSTCAATLATAASFTSGPDAHTLFEPVAGLRTLPTRSVNVVTNASSWSALTYSRFGLMHAWPAFKNLSAAAPLAARTGSASGKTTNGA